MNMMLVVERVGVEYKELQTNSGIDGERNTYSYYKIVKNDNALRDPWNSMTSY